MSSGGLDRPRSIVERIGGYELICQLAVGGMAQVHLARTVATPRRLVVIKTLPRPHRSNRERVTLFIDEMRLARLLRHPNVVELLDADVLEMQPYLVFEYIDGPSLREIAVATRARNVPLDVRLSATLAHGVCEGLHHAHEQKSEWGAPLRLVHRDISPQNVMVTQEGVVKVLDFGVARSAGQRHDTSERGLKGKISYTPPEYIMGTKPDRRGDIFALGVVLWEMLANRRLFFRTSAPATMHAVLSEAIPYPSTLNPRVPEDLDLVVKTALRRDPEKRWVTARAMGEAMRRSIEPLGGLMTLAEVAEQLRRDAPEALAAKKVLRPDMSARELSSFVTANIRSPSRREDAFESSSDGSQDGDAMEAEATTEVDLEPPDMDSQ